MSGKWLIVLIVVWLVASGAAMLVNPGLGGSVLVGGGAGIGAVLGGYLGNRKAKKVDEYRRELLESRAKRGVKHNVPDHLLP